MTQPELKTYIQERVQRAHPCAALAISEMGKFKSADTTEFLTTVADYRRPPNASEAAGTSIRQASTEDLYPALGVLIQMGEASTPALIKYMADSPSIVGRLNTEFALALIYRSRLTIAISELKLSAKNASPEGKTRLRNAAIKLSKWCSPAEATECNRLLPQTGWN